MLVFSGYQMVLLQEQERQRQAAVYFEENAHDLVPRSFAWRLYGTAYASILGYVSQNAWLERN